MLGVFAFPQGSLVLIAIRIPIFFRDEVPGRFVSVLSTYGSGETPPPNQVMVSGTESAAIVAEVQP